MMVFTLGFAIFFREAKQVVFFHMIANGAGIGLLGVLTSSIAFIVPMMIKLNKKPKIWKCQKEKEEKRKLQERKEEKEEKRNSWIYIR